jgi:hypothetical protein
MAQLGLITSIFKTLIRECDSGDKEAIQATYNTLRDLTTKPNSISRKAKAGIFEYPFLISSNVTSLEVIASIIKSNEIEIARMVQIAMGIAPTADPNFNIKIQQTLSNFHTSGSDYSFEYEDAYNPNIEEKSLTDVYNKKLGIYPKIQTESKGNNSRNTSGNTSRSNPRNTSGNNPKNTSGDDLDSPTVIYKPQHSVEKIGEKYAAMFNATIMEISLRLGMDESTQFTIPLAIKGIGHHLAYDELIYLITSYIKQRVTSPLINFIRWRSGEIRAAQFLFNYDDIMQDMAYERRIGSNNSWLRVLRSRAHNRKVNHLARVIGRIGGDKGITTSDIIPDCSFVITISDVDAIEEKTGVNLFTDPRASVKFLDDAMGLAICIIDDVHEVAHIMYSGFEKFSSYPLKSLRSKDKTEGDAMRILMDVMKKV